MAIMYLSTISMKREQAYFKPVSDESINVSPEHTYHVLSDGDEFRAIVPAPLSEFGMGFSDEVNAWLWIVDLRANHVSGKQWEIRELARCTEVIGIALTASTANGVLTHDFLHMPAGTSAQEVSDWFYNELGN